MSPTKHIIVSVIVVSAFSLEIFMEISINSHKRKSFSIFFDPFHIWVKLTFVEFALDGLKPKNIWEKMWYTLKIYEIHDNLGKVFAFLGWHGIWGKVKCIYTFRKPLKLFFNTYLVRFSSPNEFQIKVWQVKINGIAN